MGDFTMPSLGADMESGTVSKWLVAPGDTVHRGDIVAEVETEKSTIEVEIFQDGVVAELLVPPGQRVAVGTPLARVEGAAPAVVPTHRAARRRAPRPKAPRAPAGQPPPMEPAAPARPAGPMAPAGPMEPATTLSPVVRHLAAARGVDVARVAGTGPGGTVTRADVERAVRTEPARPTRRPRSSPLARRQAAELGLDLRQVVGTGPGGSVVVDDVRRAAGAAAAPGRRPAARVVAGPAAGVATETPTPVGEDGERRRAATLRRTIGDLMARSKREVPHYYLSTTIDVDTAARWLDAVNLERSVTDRLVMVALLLKATALAVRRVPEVNGFFVDGEFAPAEAVHVGVAVSLRAGGVLAPAIHDVDGLPLGELMRRLGDLVARARSGRLRSSEMSDATITVTNLGDLGVEEVFGVIYPPQVALVGFGRVGDRPYAEGGLLGVRRCLTATLSADHRVSDGHRGGRFLAEIDRLLQEPEKL